MFGEERHEMLLHKTLKWPR